MGDTTSEVHTSSADLVLALIPGYGKLRHANLDDFGGEIALLNHATHEQVDMLAATVSLCSAWRSLADPVAAATFIENAAAELDVSELIDFNDVVLAAPAALPALATGLARVWRRIATNNQTLRGNVALEGWTRLALGGWCASTLPIRGTMSTRGSNAVDGETEADIFLVRSIASAAEAWAEPDLVPVLESLAEVEDVEPDAAFELGMLDLRAAVEATDMDNAIAALGAAIGNFNRACIEGDRPDAVAFRTASEAIRDFASGRTVSANLADAVQRAVTDWLHGYLGEDRHWRQTRSDTAPQWAALVRDLAAVADIDEPAWYDTAALLADVGRIYVAYNSNTLLANPTSGAVPPQGRPQEPTPTPTPVIVAPRLDAGLAATADKLRLVDRWLTAKATNTGTAADAHAFAAISEARERLRVTPPDPPAPPGKSEASRDALPEAVREALKDLLTSGDFDDIAAFALGRVSQSCGCPRGIVHVMSRSVVLDDAAWARIAPLMPSSDGKRGRRFRDHRTVVEGIIYRYRCGVAWRDLPAEFGPWQTVWKRHHRLAGDGTWDKVMAALLAEADHRGLVDWDVAVDSTVNRAHQHGTNISRSAPATGGSGELQECPR